MSGHPPPLRFAALGDSLTEGIGDPVGSGWRGWAALLAESLAPAEDPVEFRNFAASGAQTSDVLLRQLPRALAFAPDVASVVVGVNDTLRATFDIHAVTARLDAVYGAFAERGAVQLTACLPDPGALLGLPGVLARPLARRQRAVNSVVHALSERHGAVHLHAADANWTADRALWSADRLHPGERGHRRFAARFHAVLADAGEALGPAPDVEPERAPPTRAAALWWLATAGTGWVARRCADLLPQLLALAADEARHQVRGTGGRLDARASAGVAAALASVSGWEVACGGAGLAEPRGDAGLVAARGDVELVAPRGDADSAPRRDAGLAKPSGDADLAPPRREAGLAAPRGDAGSAAAKGPGSAASPQGAGPEASPRDCDHEVGVAGAAQGTSQRCAACP